MKHSKRNFVVSSALLLICFACPRLFNSLLLAQTTHGSIVGTISDQSGALVKGASATLTGLNTGETVTVTSDLNGNYQFLNLNPGSYKVDIEKGGFKHLTRRPITVEVQGSVRIDITLQLGASSQTIEVISQTPLLQADESSLGTVVEGRIVQDSALNGRNVLNLAELAPGVIPQGSALSNPTGQNIFAWGNYQIGGGIANQSVTYIDGAPVNVNYIHLTALIPTQDAVQEFKVQTNSLGPEFGNFTGGVINIATKQGSNTIHGTAYEYIRNEKLNANTFFNNATGVPRPAFKQNQYGVTLGGPIIKDKTFFFFGWEGFALRQGLSYLLTVPTAAMRNGDFSQTGTNIYDPLTTCGVSGTPACASGQPTRQQFPGNILPANRISSVAKALESEWALPNLPGLTNNYSANAAAGGNSQQYNARIDHALSEKQHLFGRYTYWGDTNLGADPFKTRSFFSSPAEFHTQQVVLDDVYSSSSTTLFDLRLAYLRFSFQSAPDLNVDLGSLGFPNSFVGGLQFHTFPNLNIQGISHGGYNVATDINNSYSIMPSMKKVLGRHTLAFGAELRRMEQSFIQNNNPSGSFNFDNGFTSQDPNTATTSGTGFGFASFLLGYGSGGAADVLANTLGTQYIFGVYAGDTFQATNRLTVNAGLRWDYPGPWTERHDQLITFQPNATSPLASITGLPLTGNFALVNSPQRSERSETDPHRKLFAPRLGAAYRLSNKLVARAGYGIFYIPADTVFNMEPFAATINTVSTPWVPTLNSGATPNNTLSNPFPNGIQQPIGRNPAFQGALYGNSVSAPVAYEPYGYVQQWNLAIQRDLGSGASLEVAYAGAKGTHLTGLVQNLNQLPNRYLSQGTALLNQVSNPFYGIISNGTLSAPTVQAGQLLRPYPQFTGVDDSGSYNRDSKYNALQVKFEKRFKSAGSILASYTWSKLISSTDTQTAWLEQGAIYATTYTGPQDNNNPGSEKSLSLFDVPQRLVLGYTLDIPFGRGKRFFGESNGLVDGIIGGWSVSGISTFQSGFPVAIIALNNFTSQFGGGNTRPNVVPGCNKLSSGSAQNRLSGWFNTACFTQPAAFSFGNESRADSSIRTDGINNWDFAIVKNIAIRERFHLQSRSEFFNLFNRVQFGSPGPQLGTPQFGQVTSQANNPRLIQFALRGLF
jgi:hypothetical protein